MSEPDGRNPDSDRVEFTVSHDGVYLSTPCHGVRVFFPVEDAVAGATLNSLCPRDGQEWLVELVADEEAESGLRAVWTEADQKQEGGR